MQAQNPRLPCKTSGPLPFCCAMAYSWAASRYLQRPILDCVFCWSGCSCMKSLSFSVRWLHGPMVREFGSVTGNVAKEGWGFFWNIITPSLILWLTEHHASQKNMPAWSDFWWRCVKPSCNSWNLLARQVKLATHIDDFVGFWWILLVSSFVSTKKVEAQKRLCVIFHCHVAIVVFVRWKDVLLDERLGSKFRKASVPTCFVQRDAVNGQWYLRPTGKGSERRRGERKRNSRSLKGQQNLCQQILNIFALFNVGMILLPSPTSLPFTPICSGQCNWRVCFTRAFAVLDFLGGLSRNMQLYTVYLTMFPSSLLAVYVCPFVIIEGSLEVKLPTVRRDGSRAVRCVWSKKMQARAKW